MGDTIIHLAPKESQSGGDDFVPEMISEDSEMFRGRSNRSSRKRGRG